MASRAGVRVVSIGAEIIASTILAGFLVMISIVFIYRKAPCRISKAPIFGCHGVGWKFRRSMG